MDEKSIYSKNMCLNYMSMLYESQVTFKNKDIYEKVLYFLCLLRNFIII